jgi:hypothetical protein
MHEIPTQAVTNQSQSLSSQPPQIGGWLIVIAVGLVLSLIQNLNQLPITMKHRRSRFCGLAYLDYFAALNARSIKRWLDC